ncbi:hypothetical protein KFZ70_10710 [Tamlana fucoidanivorans]|uniref:Uncharacterized protein n=1 Tax=Allotamlana fucoidanivorans TaxID=2583814 RepID=A0A5C4SNH6_9FLAO|nr:hypothetical protein [Tamlana fucoidanivorans]TNJ45668.1 hypothetical protein FGF67_04615 [Tamlana fucoidanivorans]
MKKANKTLLFRIVFSITAFAIGFFGVTYLLKDDLADKLQQAATELNKQTPLEIDQYTRLDSASSIAKTNFIYHYTLKDLKKSEVNLKEVENYIKPNVIENVKNSPELKFYRDNNVTIDFKYYDVNGDFFTQISVTPELYNPKKLP